jgi:hypothetical protein
MLRFPYSSINIHNSSNSSRKCWFLSVHLLLRVTHTHTYRKKEQFWCVCRNYERHFFFFCCCLFLVSKGKRLASPLDSLNRHSPIYNNIDRQTDNNNIFFFCRVAGRWYNMLAPAKNTGQAQLTHHHTKQQQQHFPCFSFLSRLHTRRRDTTDTQIKGKKRKKKKQEPNNQDERDRLSLSIVSADA